MSKSKRETTVGVPMQSFDEEKLRENILVEARALGIPIESIRPVVDQVVRKVSDWVSTRSMVTELDLDRRIALEIKKYNKDLAYVYQNRGKII